jgi:hypothetical protein
MPAARCDQPMDLEQVNGDKVAELSDLIAWLE